MPPRACAEVAVEVPTLPLDDPVGELFDGALPQADTVSAVVRATAKPTVL